jgi:hypothetical protein
MAQAISGKWLCPVAEKSALCWLRIGFVLRQVDDLALRDAANLI